MNGPIFLLPKFTPIIGSFILGSVSAHVTPPLWRLWRSRGEPASLMARVRACVVPSLRSAPPTPKLPDHDHATAAAPRCAAPPVGLGEKKIEPPSIFLMQVGQAVPNVRHFLYEVSRITKNGKTSSDIRRFLITFEAGPGGLS